jgi:hypothetical protein
MDNLADYPAGQKEPLDWSISQEAYENYLQKDNSIGNSRLRSKNESFLDAMLSVDMNSTPEGKQILEAIKNLG